MKSLVIPFTVSLSLCLASASASAQTTETSTSAELGIPPGFLEVAGNWGFQFGEQEYVPTGSPGETEHPLTKGFGFNVTGGVQIMSGLDAILDYGYGFAESRSGEVTGVLDQVEGEIDYHTITAGVRTSRSIGAGRLYGELALGVVLPFETRLEYEYAEPMSQFGLVGKGTRTENFNLGVGGYGEAGYQIPITGAAYLSTALRLQTFQSNNDGNTTRFENFVMDFAAPGPVSMEINHGTDSGATPNTYSVQDLRFHLDLGYRF